MSRAGATGGLTSRWRPLRDHGPQEPAELACVTCGRYDAFARLVRFNAKTEEERMGDVEGNKAVIRRYVDEVQNNKNWDVYDELYAEDFVNHSAPPGVPNDREGQKMLLGAF